MASLHEGDVRNMDEHHALALLSECNDAIDRLSHEPEEKNHQRRLLEEQSLSLRAKRSSIEQIPDEIMIDIFKIVKDSDSLSVGPLLRICRRWYKITINSSLLWTDIILRFDTSPHATSIQRGTKFLESAIRYSQQGPLEINLTLPMVGRFASDMSCELLGLAETDLDSLKAHEYDHYNDVYRRVKEGIDSLPTYREAVDNLSEFMKTLAGPSGENFLRLRSLGLCYDPNVFNDWVQQRLLWHPTPILEELSIKVLTPKTLLSVQPFIHSAKKLSRIALDARYSINGLLIDSAVHSLHLDFTWTSLNAFPRHSLLRNLRYLCLKLNPYKSTPRISNKGIIFPSLEDLTIFGSYGSDFIKAPQLATLRFFGNRASAFDVGCNPYFPSVRKLHLHWSLFEGKTEPFAEYLDRHPLVEEIGIVHWNRRLVKEFIPRMIDSQGSRKITINGYHMWDMELESWRPPYSYESKEIRIDGDGDDSWPHSRYSADSAENSPIHQ